MDFYKQPLHLVTMITETYLPYMCSSYQNNKCWEKLHISSQLRNLPSVFHQQTIKWKHFPPDMTERYMSMMKSFRFRELYQRSRYWITKTVRHEMLSIKTTRLVKFFWYQARGQNELVRSERKITQKWQEKLFKNRALFNVLLFYSCLFFNLMTKWKLSLR